MKRLILVIILLILISSCSESVDKDNLKVGLIFPLSGPAAMWGQEMRTGVELAKQDLMAENKEITLIYEDSQLDPSKGISAYNKLVKIDNVDVVVVLGSRVAVPIIPLADKDKVPIISTIASANGLADQSEYSFRFYPLAEHYVKPHFETSLDEMGKKIAILYVNDEYGVSVKDEILKLSKENRIEVVFSEPFTPKTTDFSSELVKVESKSPDSLMFVGALPIEMKSVLEQLDEQGIQINFFEASTLLGVENVRNSVSSSKVEKYTNVFPAMLGGGSSFENKYKLLYSKGPQFPAILGYDVVKLISSVDKNDISKSILELGEFKSLNGKMEIKSNGEINPELISMKVRDL